MLATPTRRVLARERTGDWRKKMKKARRKIKNEPAFPVKEDDNVFFLCMGFVFANNRPE
jgi:hypothetical protein